MTREEELFYLSSYDHNIKIISDYSIIRKKLKSIKDDVEAIKNYKNSFYENERNCADSLIDDLLDELISLEI